MSTIRVRTGPDSVDRSDEICFDRVLSEDVYSELRRIASSHIRKIGGPVSLGASDLMHDAIVRMLKQHKRSWSNRKQFLSIFSIMIRRVLLNYLRGRRPPGLRASRAFDIDGLASSPGGTVDSELVLRLDDALLALERLSWRQARIAEMKIFGGLENATIADIFGVSVRSVQNEWLHARLWLKRELAPHE